jgi:PIN domain nuclease of toxin-antitoxin system
LAKNSESLLLDTHVIIWMATGDPRLKRVDTKALRDPEKKLFVSAVVACELTDLQHRGRLAMTEPLDHLRDHMGFELLDLPAEAWSILSGLPPIHRDPIDRMLIAHALCTGMTLVSADANIRRYPVDCI